MPMFHGGSEDHVVTYFKYGWRYVCHVEKAIDILIKGQP